MTLRRRVGMAAGIAAAVAVVLAAIVCYFVVRNQLRGQVDSALRAQATDVDTTRMSKAEWRERNEAAGIGVF